MRHGTSSFSSIATEQYQSRGAQDVLGGEGSQVLLLEECPGQLCSHVQTDELGQVDWATTKSSASGLSFRCSLAIASLHCLTPLPDDDR
jgi:hypothetical protein